MNEERAKKLKDIAQKKRLKEQAKLDEAVQEHLAQLDLKGEPGEDGSDGHTPTKEELEQTIKPLIPKPEVKVVKEEISPSAIKKVVSKLIPKAVNGKDGKDGTIYLYVGEWQHGVKYSLNDVVSHDGSSFVCLKAHTSKNSNEPDNGFDWKQLWGVVALRGRQGAAGRNGTNGGGGSSTGTPNRIRTFDGGGNPDDSRLYSRVVNAFGGAVTGQEIGDPNITKIGLAFADAEGVGGSQGIYLLAHTGDNSLLGFIDIDTGVSYLNAQKYDTDTFAFGVNPDGTGAGEYTFLISPSGLLVDMEQDMSSNKIVNLTDPTADQDAATKKYVDDEIAGAGGGTVDTIVAGNNIDVDATDPANPIVSVETLTIADISGITADAAEINKLDGLLPTQAELNFVDGVTSAIQTQLDGKVDLTGDEMTGVLAMLDTSVDIKRSANTVTGALVNFLTAGSAQWRLGSRISGSEDFHFHISGVGAPLILQRSTAFVEVTNGLLVNDQTANTVPYMNGSKRLTSSNVTPTELGYLAGVSSGIQNQFGGKVDLSIIQNKGDIYVGTNTSTVDNLPVGSNGQVMTADSAETMGVKWTTLQLMTRLVATPPSGGYIVPPFATGNASNTLGTTTSGTASSIFLCPIAIGESTTIDALALEVTTAATDAGATIELALGTIAGNTWTLLFSAGTADATTLGTKVISTSQTIAPGVYYAAIKFITSTTAGTNPQFRLTTATGYGYGASNSVDTNAIFSRITVGGLASSASIASGNYSVASSAATNVPRIGLRKA